MRNDTTIEKIDSNSDDSQFRASTRRTSLKSIAGIASTGIGVLTLSGLTEAKSNGHVKPKDKTPGQTAVGRGPHKLQNIHSGKVLEVADASYYNGANVQQWEWNGGNHQVWIVTEVSPSPLRQVTLENKRSGKVLEVADMGTDNGDNVQQGDWTAEQHQIWEVEKDQLRNLRSRKVLEVAGWGTDNGDNVQQWEQLDNDNQRWNGTLL